MADEPKPAQRPMDLKSLVGAALSGQLSPATEAGREAGGEAGRDAAGKAADAAPPPPEVGTGAVTPEISTVAQAQAAASAPLTNLAPERVEGEVARLVDQYFAAEDPSAKDRIVEQLATLPSPTVTAFFRAMLDNDDDDFVRVMAAVHLGQRGDSAAIEALEQQVAEPDDPELFQLAVQALAGLRGVSFFDTVEGIWRDTTNRSLDEREGALVVMEALDGPRTLSVLENLLRSITDLQVFPDHDVELALAVFLRHAHTPGAELMLDLRDRILQADALDPQTQTELVEMLEEGVDLLIDAEP